MSIKENYHIEKVSKKICGEMVKQYHYLGDRGFMFLHGYGLIDNTTNEVIGVAVYGRPCFPQSVIGWIGKQDSGVIELSRLVMNPKFNQGNYTSYLLGNSIKELKKSDYKLIISLADASIHIGYIYQACNFKYYGITDSKTDFYSIDGKINPKGKTADIQGVWLPRTQKHRYAYILDKNIEIKYNELLYPKGNEHIHKNCCNGTGQVLDKRFNILYTCPKCTGKLEIINKI